MGLTKNVIIGVLFVIFIIIGFRDLNTFFYIGFFITLVLLSIILTRFKVPFASFIIIFFSWLIGTIVESFVRAKDPNIFCGDLAANIIRECTLLDAFPSLISIGIFAGTILVISFVYFALQRFTPLGRVLPN